MADIKFNPNLPVYYGEVVKAERPRSTGLTLVPINRYSGRAVVDTDVASYGNTAPKDILERLFKDGIPADGFINNKFYRAGQELSAEQVQAQTIENVISVTGPLATLGLREARGIAGEKFVRDAEAEKKYAELVRKSGRDFLAKKGNMFIPGFAYIAGADSISPEKYANYLINLSDEEIIANVGGVNKENITASRFGINTIEGLPAGVVRTEYVQGSRVIDIPDILELAKIGVNTKDPQAAANATKQLISIFENDSSWKRREQARDALSYGLFGYTGSPGGAKGVYGADRPSGTGSRGTGSAGFTGSTDFEEMDFVASDGRIFNTKSAMNQYETNLVKRANRQSAFEELQAEMAAIGLGALVEPLRGLIEQDVSASEFAIKLRETEEYKKRFIGNQARISKGLRVLTPGEYIKVEDAYRQTLRAYGLSQFDNVQYVTKFIDNDISAAQLSERVSLAVDRIQNADPLIARTLREYYPGITQQDLVGYILDPSTQLPSIQQKVAAAEIGSAARRQGIEPGVSVASQLAAQGITQAEAQRGYATIADVLPTAEKLSGLYGKGMETYGLAEGEQDVFNQLASAQRKRKNLIGREIAEFSGQSGVGRGSLGTEIGGQY